MESALQGALVAIRVTECQDNKIVPSGDGRPSVEPRVTPFVKGDGTLGRSQG